MHYILQACLAKERWTASAVHRTVRQLTADARCVMTATSLPTYTRVPVTMAAAQGAASPNRPCAQRREARSCRMLSARPNPGTTSPIFAWTALDAALSKKMAREKGQEVVRWMSCPLPCTRQWCCFVYTVPCCNHVYITTYIWFETNHRCGLVVI